jgi:aryl-alcohol dehydrogenase-like predicted oxidoreductase
LNPDGFNRVWLGGNLFGYSVLAEDTFKILDKALELGILGIDTSSSYSEGQSENLIGMWLNRNIENRNLITISTKVGRQSNELPNGLGHPDKIKTSLVSSLKRLKTDYIDVLFLHAPDPDTNALVTISTFMELYQRKMIKGFGFCNAKSENIKEYFEVISKLGIDPNIFYIQNYFNWVRRDENYWDNVADLQPKLHFNSVSYGLLARGIFTDKPNRIERESRVVKSNAVFKEYNDSNNMEKINRIRNICLNSGQNIYNFSLAYGYYLSKKSIIGVRNLNQLNQLYNFYSEPMGVSDFRNILSKIRNENIKIDLDLGDPFYLNANIQ